MNPWVTPQGATSSIRGEAQEAQLVVGDRGVAARKTRVLLQMCLLESQDGGEGFYFKSSFDGAAVSLTGQGCCEVLTAEYFAES